MSSLGFRVDFVTNGYNTQFTVMQAQASFFFIPNA